MDKHIYVLLLVFILGFSDFAFSQNKKHSFILKSGMSIPAYHEGVVNRRNICMNFGTEYEYRFSEKWSGGISFTYQSFGLNKEGVKDEAKMYDPAVNVTGSPLTIITLFANTKLRFKIQPKQILSFFSFGVGYFRLLVDDTIVEYQGSTALFLDNSNENSPGISAGYGMEIPVKDNIFLIFECCYVLGIHHGGNTGFIPFKIGLKF